MNVAISPELKKGSRHLALGVVFADVVVCPSPGDLLKIIDGQARRADQEIGTLADLNRLPQITALRDLYKALGKDPTRYRGSAEALLRRVLQGKGLYRVNNVVDINNLVSIATRHSVGSYDIANLAGDVVFGVGQKGQSYKGIGKDTINIAELPVFLDDQGPFGSPTSDSERAMITISTKKVMMIVISATGTGLSEGMAQAAEMLHRFANASQVEPQVVL